MDRKTLQKDFTTMLEFKKQVDALNFIIGTWRQEIEDVVLSPDFKKLTREELEELIIPNARALRFWNTQLEDFMDKNLSVWKNRAAKSKSKELNITLEQAIKEFAYIPKGMQLPAIPEHIEPEPIKEPETPIKVEAEKKVAVNDEDTLLESMIKNQ